MEARDRARATQVRRDIGRGTATPATFRAALARVPPRDRDAWVDRVLQIDGIPPDDAALPRGCVPYLPCAVDTLLDFVEHADIGPEDVVVDIGAGIGRATALVHLLTGAGCIGLEIQPGLVREARRLAARLSLSRAVVIEGDAADLTRHMTIGTVFFLYCPFSGARLERVLGDLQSLAAARPIRIGCVDLPLPPCEWLVPVAVPGDVVTIHRSAFCDRSSASGG